MRATASAISLLLICLAAAALALASLLAPDMDLAVARWFYEPAAHRFPAMSDPSLVWLRDLNSMVVIASIACMAAALLRKLILPTRPMLLPGRAIIFLAVTLALGPGVVVNGILKMHWGRPRPIEVTQFGGVQHYVPWWNYEGTCPSNCSFVSGESSTAAWTFAPAILVPPPWRAVALGAAAIFTATISALRMAFGGHFFTDVAFGVLLTALVIWMMHGLIYRWPRTRLDEQAVDRAIGKIAIGLRRLVRAATRGAGRS